MIRHAKSSWDQPNLPDVARSLNNRGIKACKTIAGPILKSGCNFENVFCSIATRAQQTISGINNELSNLNITWKTEKDLYTFSEWHLLNWLSNLEEVINQVVIVGHNPGFTLLANKLGDQPIVKVPTCGYVKIALPIERWADVEFASGRTVVFLKPKMFR